MTKHEDHPQIAEDDYENLVEIQEPGARNVRPGG